MLFVGGWKDGWMAEEDILYASPSREYFAETEIGEYNLARFPFLINSHKDPLIH